MSLVVSILSCNKLCQILNILDFQLRSTIIYQYSSTQVLSILVIEELQLTPNNYIQLSYTLS